MWIRELGVSIVDDTEFSRRTRSYKMCTRPMLNTFETENDEINAS